MDISHNLLCAWRSASIAEDGRLIHAVGLQFGLAVLQFCKVDDKNIFPNRELYGYGYDAYLYTDDQEKLEKEFLEKGVKIVKPLNVTDYKNKEFVIEDIDGRWIAFGLKIKD